MGIEIFKSLHVIGFVAWFAGLFYLVRLFVYHREAMDKAPDEKKILTGQYEIMESRLYKIITNPAMILTWVGGIGMLIINTDYLTFGWMQTKLVLLVLLTGYHHMLPGIMRKLSAEQSTMSSFRFRLFNELPTLFLIGIVLLAVYKDLADVLWVFLTLIGVSILLFLFAHWYKKRREST